MRAIAIIFLTLLATASAAAQTQPTVQPATRAATSSTARLDYFEKRDRVFDGKPDLTFHATLLKARQDYLIVNDEHGQQQVIWLSRYATIRKQHRGFFAKTRKAYLYELVPGTDAKLETVRDEQGRLLLKKMTVYDTVQEFEPVAKDEQTTR